MALLLGCGRKPEMRHYEEIVLAPPESALPAAGANKPLTWKTPPGWKEMAGSGMRLISFAVGSGEATGDASIVLLGGDAGGLAANVERWIGQLGLPVPPRDEFDAFLAGQKRFKTAGGSDGIFVDLTRLPNAGTAGHALFAAVISRGGGTVFVKLTGPPALLERERDRFVALCESLE